VRVIGHGPTLDIDTVPLPLPEDAILRVLPEIDVSVNVYGTVNDLALIMNLFIAVYSRHEHVAPPDRTVRKHITRPAA
jgi:hypothetical protein